MYGYTSLIIKVLNNERKRLRGYNSEMPELSSVEIGHYATSIGFKCHWGSKIF